MNDMPKQNKVANRQRSHYFKWRKVFLVISGIRWQYIKWYNLLRLVIVTLIIIGLYFLGYKLYEYKVTTPSVPIQLSFTISPGGGGKGDTLVTTPVSEVTFARYGQEKTYVNLHFGPWEKALQIKEVEVHPIILVEKDTNIDLTLSLKDREIKIGSFNATAMKTTQIGTNTVVAASEAHISKSLDGLVVPAGVSGEINFIAYDTQLVIINSDSYVWFDALQARFASIPSWWESIVNNQLADGLIIAIFTFILIGTGFETASERMQREQINVLKEIEKHLSERNIEPLSKPEASRDNIEKRHK